MLTVESIGSIELSMKRYACLICVDVFYLLHGFYSYSYLAFSVFFLGKILSFGEDKEILQMLQIR